MPLDPATIRATAQRVVNEWVDRGTHNVDALGTLLVQAGADLAAQSHATALADAEREAARKAWDAAREYWWEHGFNGRGGVDIARNTYLAREYPETRECVLLSDGRVVEWMQWDTRRGVSNERTLDLVTNKGKPGCESRRCYKSLDDMRATTTLTWADWQLIDKAFAEAVR